MTKTSPSLHIRPIWLIATNSFREMVRDKLLYGILIVAALITASSFFLSTISLDQNTRIIQNIGLAAIHFGTAIIAIFITTTSINREFEGRALYILFPKPISRAQYILGKYLGIILLLITTLLLLGGLFTLGLTYLNHALFWNCVFSLIASFLEISLLVAIAELFTTFTAPLNATLYTLALFIIGHALPTMKLYASKSGTVFVRHIVDFVYYILPNLEKFSVRHALLYHLHIPVAAIVWALLYWLVYTCLILFLAVQVIKHREV
jgi:Cu-processing system permease protein